MSETSKKMSVAPISTADITDEIWLEVARNHAGATPLREAADRARQAGMPAVLDHSTMPTPLPSLLALEGMPFMEAAYATTLGRPPDEAGIAYITAELLKGRSKVELLGELEASAEGKRSGRVIAGLRRRYLVHRVYRVPVVGPVIRLGSTVLRRTGVSRLLGSGSPSARQQELDTRFSGFTATIDKTRRALEERVSEQQMAIDLLTRRLTTQEETGRKAIAMQGEMLATLSKQSAKLAQQFASLEDSVIDSMLALSETVQNHQSRLTSLEGAVDTDAARAQIETAAGSLRLELDGRMLAAEQIARQNRQDVADQQRRIGLMLNSLNAVKAMGHAIPAEVNEQDDHALDSLYVAFEDRFRGTRRAIKDRQRVYLPRLHAAGAGTADRAILDIGAGRGEFLELMRDEGLVARGVDTNITMAAVCREQGLDCVEGDALAYLAALPPGSLGAITGFHIIEHLPFKVMVRIMDEALRALAPGGLLILETPNPANLLTASRWFYLDPTHRNPLPGEMVAMIAEARGFPNPEIVELHPMDARFPGSDRPLAEALDRVFYGPQDYALVARKA
ncbi:bifunctional 2-polyprenyl-6-hydroxyphenol methylase/3-demethylubiquinol 3-O-methyltransferase UbiG [Acidisphaera sp. L21]|uniref:class I SAM-dependent methyltransferase n=1 Tax=Acidisphaera sp. L21 TaxID=1641851 RepID=UPI00131C67D7|nr:class I SAM-dependent methyltransferase [Acidisphaera sp. L21]